MRSDKSVRLLNRFGRIPSIAESMEAILHGLGSPRDLAARAALALGGIGRLDRRTARAGRPRQPATSLLAVGRNPAGLFPGVVVGPHVARRASCIYEPGDRPGTVHKRGCPTDRRAEY